MHEYELFCFADIIFYSDSTFKDEVVKVEDVKEYYSQKARLRGIGYKIIKIGINELYDLLFTVQFMWDSIKKSELLSVGDIFVFLGYGRYYHFHNDYLLSFANTWMFIEATLNLMWEKMMINNNFSSKYLNANSRNWTLQIKIDELLLKGLLDVEIANKAHNLRSMRNNVFHVSKDVKKGKLIVKYQKTALI